MGTGGVAAFMDTTDTHDSNTTVGLLDLARIVVRLRWYILGGVALGLTVVTSILLLMTPVYRAEIAAMPAEDSQGAGSLPRLAGQFGGLAALAGITMPSGTNRDEAIAVLKSRQFALQMISDLDLLPVLFANRWDPVNNNWKAGTWDRAPTADDAWRLWDKTVRGVLDDRDRGLIITRVQWRDRELAATWANEMIRRLNETLRSRRLAELDQSIEYLNGELGRTQVVELRAAIAQVMQTQISERMLANVREEFALKIIDPALPADEDRPVRPRPTLYVMLGLSAGALFGFALGLLVVYVQSSAEPLGRR